MCQTPYLITSFCPPPPQPLAVLQAHHFWSSLHSLLLWGWPFSFSGWLVCLTYLPLWAAFPEPLRPPQLLTPSRVSCRTFLSCILEPPVLNCNDLFSCTPPQLEKEMAAHSSILAWRISWTEEPGWLWSMGSQKSRTRLNWLSTHVSSTSMQVSWGQEGSLSPLCVSDVGHACHV